jgi:hypothetical protein
MRRETTFEFFSFSAHIARLPLVIDLRFRVVPFAFSRCDVTCKSSARVSFLELLHTWLDLSIACKVFAWGGGLYFAWNVNRSRQFLFATRMHVSIRCVSRASFVLCISACSDFLSQSVSLGFLLNRMLDIFYVLVLISFSCLWQFLRKHTYVRALLMTSALRRGMYLVAA